MEGHENSKNLRLIQFGHRRQILVVYQSEGERCNPCFETYKKAKEFFFKPGVISIPVFDEGELWVTIQVETEA